MKFSIYNIATGEVVKTITCGKLSQAEASCSPGEAVSSDAPPPGFNDRDFKIDPSTGKHRNKTAAEKKADNDSREHVRDQMWQREMHNRADHRQRLIDKGTDAATADAIIEAFYGNEQRQPKGRHTRRKPT